MHAEEAPPLWLNLAVLLIAAVFEGSALRVALRAFKDVSLFISATNVHTGRVHVFPQDKLDADVVMASACLPTGRCGRGAHWSLPGHAGLPGESLQIIWPASSLFLRQV